MSTHFISRRLPRLARPDLTPVASVFLVLSVFFLLTYFPREPRKGVVTLEETPGSQVSVCIWESSAPKLFIGLTAGGQVSFAISDSSLQLATLQQTGRKYGVHFSPAQRVNLARLPFLAVSLKQLPAVLSAPVADGPATLKPAVGAALTETQLLECIQAAQLISVTETSLPARVYLYIDASANASLVMHLFGRLRSLGITRLNLVTHYRT